MITLFAEAPALPLHSAGKYVAAAYIVFVLVLLIYVTIMARRLIGNQRELLELKARIEERERTEAATGAAGAATSPAGPGTSPSFANENDNDSDSHSHLRFEDKGMTTDEAEVS